MHIIEQPFQKEWHDLMNGVKRCTIATPPGHGCTTQLLIHIKRLLAHDATLRIAYIAASKELANSVFDNSVFDNSVFDLTAYGVLDDPPLQSFDAIFVDSPVTLSNSKTSHCRKAVITAICDNWLPMLYHNGSFVLAGCPIYEDDAIAGYGRYTWPTIWRPAPGLWPTRFTPEILEDKRLELGNQVFNQQYMLIPNKV